MSKPTQLSLLDEPIPDVIDLKDDPLNDKTGNETAEKQLENIIKLTHKEITEYKENKIKTIDNKIKLEELNRIPTMNDETSNNISPIDSNTTLLTPKAIALKDPMTPQVKDLGDYELANMDLHEIEIEESYSSQSLSSSSAFDFEHGVLLSRPTVYFRDDLAETNSSIKEIHDLLIDKDARLFFVTKDEYTQHSLRALNSIKEENNSDSEMSESEYNEKVKKSKDGKKDSTRLSHLFSKVLSTKKKNSPKQDTTLIKGGESNSSSSKSSSDNTTKTVPDEGSFTLSEGNPSFNYISFIREFLYNYFHLFALPFVFLFENKTGAVSRCYWGNAYGYSTTIKYYIFFLLYLTINILWYNLDNSGYYFIEILLFNLFWIVRIICIAIKWGYLPEGIFILMRKQVLTREQFGMIHLLGGWIGTLPATLAREIGQTCARLELDINKMDFDFRLNTSNETVKSKISICSKKKTYKTYGNLLIPYVVFIGTRILNKYVKLGVLFSTITAPIVMLLPILKRLLERDYNKLNINELLFLIIFYIIGTYNIRALFLFNNIIALDFKRRYQLIKFTTNLIRPNKNAFFGDLFLNSYKSHLFPNRFADNDYLLLNGNLQTLDLTNYKTLYNWSKLRSFFLDFGLRFLKREEADLAVTILLVFVMLISYIILIYLNFINIRFLDGLFVIFIVIFLMLPAAMSLRYADLVNDRLSKQRYILAEKVLRLKREEIDFENNIYLCTKNNIRNAQIIMNKIIEMLRNERFAIHLFGYAVNTTVTGIFAAIIGSIGFTTARLVAGSFG